jgi:hypothetical protein
MRIAIGTEVCNEWEAVGPLLEELNLALGLVEELEASLWLVDNGSTRRPSSWNALEAGTLETHVLELNGRHGRYRAISAALGFLACELDAGFDAYVILRSTGEHRPAAIPSLLKAAARNPGCVIVAGRKKAPGYGDFLLLPAGAAEALCHSPHAGVHLPAAIEKMELARVPIAVPRGDRYYPRSSRRRLAEKIAQRLSMAAVFRDQISQRILAALGVLLVAAALSTAVALALKLLGIAIVPPAALALAVAALVMLAPTFLVALILCLNSISLQELRRWTPALDGTTLVRGTTTVRRAPYAISFPAQTNADRR